MKKIIYILIFILMILFKNTALAKYEKLFYDFEINDVSGKSLNLNIFKTYLAIWKLRNTQNPLNQA